MYKYSDIIGQNHIKEHFKNSVKNDMINHAYIINGEKSSGKMMLAKMFALSVLCEKKNGEPCLECESCKKAMSGRHPDLIFFAKDTSKKTDIIDVASMREQVVNSIYTKPIDGNHKIYIIDDADKMNAPAQNALLKTLEEPPSYGHIILLTRNCDRLLPTIISRCIILNMRPVEDKAIRQYLKDNFKILDSQAEVAAKMSGGNVGKARLLAEGSDFFEFNNEIISILKDLPESDINDILKFVDTLVSYTKKKDEGAVFSTEDIFELMILWYRDVLLYKAAKDTENLTFNDELSDIIRQSQYYTYEALNSVISEINEAKSKIMSNVNFETVMELLFIKIERLSRNIGDE